MTKVLTEQISTTLTFKIFLQTENLYSKYADIKLKNFYTHLINKYDNKQKVY